MSISTFNLIDNNGSKILSKEEADQRYLNGSYYNNITEKASSFTTKFGPYTTFSLGTTYGNYDESSLSMDNRFASINIIINDDGTSIDVGNGTLNLKCNSLFKLSYGDEQTFTDETILSYGESKDRFVSYIKLTQAQIEALTVSQDNTTYIATDTNNIYISIGILGFASLVKTSLPTDFFLTIESDGTRRFYNNSKLVNGDSLCDNVGSPILVSSEGFTSMTSSNSMFNGSSGLVTFKSDLPLITRSEYMFNGCSGLTTFTSNLPLLTFGSYMFNSCSKITTFTTDLPLLNTGEGMFNGCSKLVTFMSVLPSLNDGNTMFSGCSSLTTVTTQTPLLVNGAAMFNGCTSLTSFISSLPSLSFGALMFSGCKLDKPSVLNILNTIPVKGGSKGIITIGAAKILEGDATITAAITAASLKNWNVTISYNV